MRSPQDWAALKRAEESGRERSGTYERLWREEQELLEAEKKKKMEEDFAKALRLHKEVMKK